MVVAAAVLAACGGGGTGSPDASTSSATTSPAPGPTPSAVALDAAAVKAAAAATRKAGTAAYTIEGATVLGPIGRVTVRREGAYDATKRLASQTQSFTAQPPGLLGQLTGRTDVEPSDLDTESVVAGDTAYVRMAMWPKSLGGKWLRISAGEIATAQGLDEVDVQTFPQAVTMLAVATDGDEPGTADTAYVKVPAAEAFLAFPSSSTRKLVAAGVVPGKLTGTVDVEVRVENGLVTGVSFDAVEVYRQALGMVGQGQQAKAITGVETTLTLAAHGEPVAIAVPAAARTMTLKDLQRAR